MKRLLSAICVLLLLTGVASAQLSGGLQFPGPGTVHSTGGGGCTPGQEATAFLARASVGINTTAYCTYINAAVSNGWFKTMDVLHVYATDSSADGLLNLVTGASFTGTISGTTLTVSALTTGTVIPNVLVSGVGVAGGTYIVSGSGTTWTVNNSQTIGSITMTTAGLQAVTATITGSPAFSANNGFTGVDATNAAYIDTIFNPATTSAATVGGGVTNNYTLTNAHISVWPLTNVTSGASGGNAMGSQSGSANNTRIFPRYQDTNFYSDVNSSTTSSSVSGLSTSIGLFMVTRCNTCNAGSIGVFHYNNTTLSRTSTEATQTSLLSANIRVLCGQDAGSCNLSSGLQVGAATIGSHLDSTLQGLYYSDTCTLLTTLHGSC